MSQEQKKLTFREKAGYGFGDLASCLFWTTIMTQLLFFYTDVFHLTAKAAGLMFLISRLLDAAFDVIIGMTADRTKSRWGKFRPYILWGAIPLSVLAFLSFTTPDLAYTAKLVYAYGTFIVFMFFYSFVNIPYTALLGVISDDPVDRTSASSFKFIGAYLSGIIVSATVLPLAAHFGPNNPAHGWSVTMGIYGVAAVIFFFITFLSTRERIQPIAKEKTSIKNDLKDLGQNVPWILLFIVTILFIFFVCIRLSVTTHYFKYYVGEQVAPWLSHSLNILNKYILNPIYSLFGKLPTPIFEDTHKYGFEVLASIFNTLGQALSLVGVVLVPWFTKKVGRKAAVIILFGAALFFTSSFYFFKPENLTLILTFQILGSITGGPVSALLWVLYADTADYSEWKTGRRATGLVFSASIMSTKVGWAVGSMIAAFILSLTGFIPNVIQNLDVQSGLKAMMSIIPAGAGLIGLIILVFFYKLDEPTMKKVKEDLDERRKASGETLVA